MCTLIVLKGLYTNYPLVIAANRDELLDRPSETPQIRENGIYAPKDLQRGGSWTGVNDSGIFVGLTNRMDIKSQPGRLSRGQLVMDLLACKAMSEAEQYIQALAGESYNGFNLVVADQSVMYIVRGDGVRITYTTTGGVVVVSNHGVNLYEEIPRRVGNVLRTWEKYPQLQQMPDTSILRNLLDIHDDWRYGTCINQPEQNYGTKSSHIVRLDKQNKEWEYWHRERTGDEHICKDAFRIYTRFPIKV